MDRLKSTFLAQVVVIYTRFLLGGGFVFASIIKIKGRRFTTESQEDADFGTAMHFFETMYQTGLYWQFLGWGQLLIPTDDSALCKTWGCDQFSDYPECLHHYYFHGLCKYSNHHGNDASSKFGIADLTLE